MLRKWNVALPALPLAPGKCLEVAEGAISTCCTLPKRDQEPRYGSPSATRPAEKAHIKTRFSEIVECASSAAGICAFFVLRRPSSVDSARKEENFFSCRGDNEMNRRNDMLAPSGSKRRFGGSNAERLKARERFEATSGPGAVSSTGLANDGRS
jgi:hypothetical protein